MKTFIIVFILAILFVVGSAGAMRYLDRRIPPKKKDDDRKS